MGKGRGSGEDERQVRAPVAERDPVVQRLFAVARGLVKLGYFSFEVEGIEHLPRDGRVVYALNHSGWFPLDAFFVTFAIAEAHGLARAPYFATADAALAVPGLGPFLRHFGAVPASWFRRPERLPAEVAAIGMFPEGVRGNTKPFWHAYQMKAWNRGFVRVALARQAPIVPGAILGGEECLPVAWTVRLLEPLIGEPLGMPLSPVPLPSHWKLVFHPPVHLDQPPAAASDHAYCAEVAARLQGVVQGTLDREAARRPLGRFAARLAEPDGASPGPALPSALRSALGPQEAPGGAPAAAAPEPEDPLDPPPAAPRVDTGPGL